MIGKGAGAREALTHGARARSDKERRRVMELPSGNCTGRAKLLDLALIEAGRPENLIRVVPG